LFFVLIGSYAWMAYSTKHFSTPSNVQVLKAAYTSSSYFLDSIDFIPTPQRAGNEEIKKITRRVLKKVHRNKKVFIDLRYDLEINTYKDFFTQYKKAFGLRGIDEMRLIKSNENTWKYQQYYKGIKVIGGEYSITKVGNKKIFKAQGSILENLELDTISQITSSEAIQIVLDSLNSEDVKFAWQDSLKCEQINNSNKSCYPNPILVISVQKRMPFEADNARLFYKFKIHLAGLAPSYQVVINANSGRIEYLYEDIQHSCISAKVATQQHGSQSFEIEQIGSEYALMAKCIGGNNWGGWVVPKSENSWTGSCNSYNSCLIKQNTPNGWITPTINQKAASALFAVEASYKYYKNNFGTWGYNNLKVVLESNTIGMGGDNTLSSTGILKLQADGNYTSSNGIGYFVYNVNDLETIGHEIFHAIDQTHNSVWVIFDDMATITEATADIFGAIITMKTLNESTSSYDWIYGNSSTPTQRIMRSFKEPNQYGYHYESGIVDGQPDFYKQTPYWIDLQSGSPIALDHYVNTGVINHWFYLLTNGGSNNVNGVTQTVKNGISIDDIAKVLFHAFTDNDGLTNSDNVETFAQKITDKAYSLLTDNKLSTNDKSTICRIIEAFNAVNLQPESPTCFLDYNINIQKVSASDQCDCTASLEICGADNYDIQWQNANKQSIEFPDPLNVTGLCNQQYTVIISVAGCEDIEETIDCRNSDTGQNIEPPLNEGDLNVQEQIVNNCGIGDVLLSVTGGNPPYSFAWSDGSAGQDLIGVSAGTYYVTVSNPGQGVVPVVGGPYQVGYPIPSISAQLTQPCHGSNTGSIYASAFGGTPPYSYQWSTGDNTQGISVTIPTHGNDIFGFYTVTVTDFYGCTAQKTFYLNDKAEIFLNASIGSACPSSNDGYIQLTASGGTAPYSYQWNNNQWNNSSISNLSAQTYNVTLTDGIGCQKMKSFTVPSATTTPEQDPTNCTIWSSCRGVAVTSPVSVAYPQPNYNSCQVDLICPINNNAVISSINGVTSYTYGGSAGTSLSNSTCLEFRVCHVPGYSSYSTPTGNTIAPQNGDCRYDANMFCCEIMCGNVVVGTYCQPMAIPPNGSDLGDYMLIAKPNPFNNYLNLQFDSPTNRATLTLRNTIGQIALAKSIEPQIGQNNLDIRLDNTNLSQGLYILTIQFDDGTTISTKLIHQNR